MHKDHEGTTKLSRRTFIGLASAAGATAVGFGALSACAKPTTREAESSEPKQTVQELPAGKWVPTVCDNNCGGLCLNKAYVVDGVILRQKTDDTHEDTPLNPQQRGCARGRSQRKSIYAIDRLKYPMKRRHWEVGGGDKELRGRDEWVRISWDEALDIIASEYQRIISTYGNKAILRGPSCYALSRFSLAMGGIVRSWGTVSYGSFPIPTERMMGVSALAIYMSGSLSTDSSQAHLSASGGGAVNTANDRLDMLNSKLIVLWGANPAWASAGGPAYHILQARNAGARIICIDPICNATAVALADQWIPIRPATDTAMLLGAAYHMIANNLQDQDFLDTYCSGFDAEHMPNDAPADSNFKDYVLGTYDGQAKTPQWASAICGVDADIIKSFAEEIATTKPLAFLASYGPSKVFNGETFAQAFYTVGWMTGNVGKPGSCVGHCSFGAAFNHGFRLVNYGADGLKALPNPLWTAKGYCIPPQDPNAEGWYGPVEDQLWESVVSGKCINGPKGEVECDFKMIDNLTYGNSLNQMPNINEAIRAHRKVEFVASADMFPSPTVQYADVILPVTHAWERWGCTSRSTSHREILVWGSQTVEPAFESRDDEWIQVELGKRCGLAEEDVLNVSLKQQVFNRINGATVVGDDGRTLEPLVTVTEQDLLDFKVTGNVQQGRIGIKEFQEKGVYQVERNADDNLGFIAFEDFIRDPQNFPLKTESGKFEIYCPSLEQWIRDYGFSTIAPVAKYLPPKHGYEETLVGPYTLQFTTPHVPKRAHSVHDNNVWLREAFNQDLFISNADAMARKLEDGDTVKVYNDYGTTIRRVKVTERIMSGVVALGDGGWVSIDPQTGYDMGGAPNILQGSIPSGEGSQSWNCNVVEVEKYDKQLDLDTHIPVKVLDSE
ncbi:MAG: molybdopterin-dependent oxidoreductase [Coriobacteriales bacterium]|jgi:anaerobic dimethyl sulfoxide reductase subunit A|nr:molybdopterin-dependent oxidoreductase [Coriobacteriales bacterium]